MPLYNKAWAAANPKKYLELVQPPPECEICFESFTAESPACSPLLGERATKCRHFACKNCWAQIMEQPREHWRCPQCRENVQQWLDDHYEECISTPFEDNISFFELAEFLQAALRELRDRPQFVEMGKRILQRLHASQ